VSQVAEIIERIREIAKEAAKIDADLDKLHCINRDLGIRHGDPKEIARRQAINAAEVELEEYLDSLDLDTLRRIEALMYSGRGDGSAVELRQQLAKSHPSKEDVVRTIMEKRVSFDPYFDRGLNRAKADGIDLDSF
jgi:hypothetical protein